MSLLLVGQGITLILIIECEKFGEHTHSGRRYDFDSYNWVCAYCVSRHINLMGHFWVVRIWLYSQLVGVVSQTSYRIKFYGKIFWALNTMVLVSIKYWG